jgi:hypothetical protein
MINHFQTKVQTKLDMEEEQNHMIMTLLCWDLAGPTQQ